MLGMIIAYISGGVTVLLIFSAALDSGEEDDDES